MACQTVRPSWITVPASKRGSSCTRSNPSSNNPSSRARRRATPLLGLLALVVIAGLCAVGGVIVFGGDDKPVDVVVTDQSTNAEVMCEQFINKQLKAPATAKYPKPETSKDGATYTVKGGVDSENSFGALVRTPYTCVIRADGDDKWTLVNLDLAKI